MVPPTFSRPFVEYFSRKFYWEALAAPWAYLRLVDGTGPRGLIIYFCLILVVAYMSALGLVALGELPLA